VALLAALLALTAPAHAATGDADGDGMPDSWERAHDLDPARADASGDPDGDRLANLDEYRHRTNPHRRDTDADGLSDRVEIVNSRTNPHKRDTNGDGRRDGADLYVHSEPAIWPAFDPDVSDYVVRCAKTGSVRFHVAAPRGTTVAVDGGAARSGAFSPRRKLLEDQALSFTVHSPAESTTYHMRCLPAGFPLWTYSRPGTPSQAFYIVTPSPFVLVYDDHGVPVWWMRRPFYVNQDAKLFGDGTIGWYSTDNSFVGAPAGYEFHRFDGSLVSTVKAYTASSDEPTMTDIHDIQRLANGDHLVVGYRRRATRVDLSFCGGPSDAVVIDGQIQRIRPGVAEPVWNWSTRDHIALRESARWCTQSNLVPLPEGGLGYDIIHINDVQLRGDSLVISTRHTDAAYKIAYPSGNIVWKLGGTQTAQSLKLVGDPYPDTSFGGPHFARQLGDGTITVHDNRTQREGLPRAVRYSIDEGARTATLLEQVTDPAVDFSNCCGTAKRLADGGWLIDWGGRQLVEELARGGARRYALTMPYPWYSYRVAPVARGRLSRAVLRAGMDAMHPRG
jgi:hypothetical protein